MLASLRFLAACCRLSLFDSAFGVCRRSVPLSLISLYLVPLRPIMISPFLATRRFGFGFGMVIRSFAFNVAGFAFLPFLRSATFTNFLLAEHLLHDRHLCIAGFF